MSVTRGRVAAAPINVFRPTLGAAELAVVEQTFASGWIGKGPRNNEFETAFAVHLGVERECVRSIDCCTEGLFLSMELIGVGPGDEVVMPTVAFVGMPNAVLARGAQPIFCDVDPWTLNPRAEDVERALTDRTRAVMIIHYGGDPGDVAAIAAMCRERGVTLVEDAACSVASRIPEGACGTLGDIGVWSFDSMKILVTGDGGMMYFRDPEMAARMEIVSRLGLVALSGHERRGQDRWWEITVSEPGRRSIMNDITAGIGCVQLQRLPSFIKRRGEVRAAYDEGLAGLPGVVRRPAPPADHVLSDYFYWIQLSGSARDRLAHRLRELDIYTTFKYHPLHTLPIYGHSPVLPGAEKAAATTLCLPIHQALSDDDIDCVTVGVREFAEREIV
jgi:aminotransferase